MIKNWYLNSQKKIFQKKFPFLVKKMSEMN